MLKTSLFLPCLLTVSLLSACASELLPKADQLLTLPQPSSVSAALRFPSRSSPQPTSSATPMPLRPILLTETPTPSPSASPTTNSPASATPTPVFVPVAPTPPSLPVSTLISLKEPRELSYIYRFKQDRTALQLTPGAEKTIIEDRTRSRLRFTPRPDRSLEVDLWLESQEQVMYDIIDGVIRNERAPSLDGETSLSTETSSGTEHYRVLYDSNGDLTQILEPARATRALAEQLENLLGPFFSAYSPTIMRQGESFPAKTYLLNGNIQKIFTGSRISNHLTPSWLIKSAGSDIELSYRGEISLTRSGVTLNLKESGSSRLDADTGLLRELKVKAELDASTGARLAPVELEIQRL